MRALLALLLAFLSSSAFALATVEKTDYILDQTPYPFLALEAGKSQFALELDQKQSAGGYESPSGNNSRIRGGSLRWTYAFCDHFALGAHLGLGFGERTVDSSFAQTFSSEKFKTYPIGVHAVFDGFDRSWRFRLPVFAAYTYNWVRGDFSLIDVPNSTHQVGSYSGSSPQLEAGVSPQANFGAVRVALLYAFLKNLAPSFTSSYENRDLASDQPYAGGTAALKGNADVFTALLGVEVGVPDWGVSVGWSQLSVDFNQQSAGNGIWKLKWSKSF